MSIRTTCRAKAAAKSIREHLKELGVRPKSVTCRPGDLNNRVKVKLVDACPDEYRKVEQVCRQHRVLVNDPSIPGRLIPNPASGVPQITTVELVNVISDDLYHSIWQYIRNYTLEKPCKRGVWDRFTGSVADFWNHWTVAPAR